MYPNLYYVFKDWFGVEWKALSFLNTFGLMVALGFLVGAWLLSLELKRKEKQGLLHPLEENIVIGKPASFSELFSNGLIGFIFGYKFLGLFISKPDDISPQEFIFSSQGSIVGGLILALVIAGVKWNEKNRQKLKEPESRVIRIWPHDRVGDIVVLGLIFGIFGAKLFDNLEHWDDFWAHPIQSLFSQSGLAFYGGLIVASIAIIWYSVKKKITIKYLVDAAAPSLIIAYAIGRIGCQISGDGDWGIYNSAYISDNLGNVSVANNNEFENNLKLNSTYYLKGSVNDGDRMSYVTDRTYPTLKDVPHKSIIAPSFLPVWLFAYSYPQNVNIDGIIIPKITDPHNRVLPQPVFPTPLYETIICSLIFLILWIRRKKIKTPLMMFGIYLLLNGIERLFIEKLRVNRFYNILGFQSTQAQFIAILLIIGGLGLIIFSQIKLKIKES